MESMESQTENKFESMLYQTEIERVKYLLKSYLRCRLWKASGFDSSEGGGGAIQRLMESML